MDDNNPARRGRRIFFMLFFAVLTVLCFTAPSQANTGSLSVITRNVNDQMKKIRVYAPGSGTVSISNGSKKVASVSWTSAGTKTVKIGRQEAGSALSVSYKGKTVKVKVKALTKTERDRHIGKPSIKTKTIKSTTEEIKVRGQKDTYLVILNDAGETVKKTKFTKTETKTISIQPQADTQYLYFFSLKDGKRSSIISKTVKGGTKASDIASTAKKFQGTKYVWGGSSPSGFDCSGFVYYVINHSGNGYNYKRSNANSLRSKCTKISKSSMKAGDLIFFKNTYKTSGASHVGIYLGDNMMIQASSGSGKVIISSINSKYWKSHYIESGRL